MIKVIFWVIFLCFQSIGIYFLWRFILHRRHISLVLAVLPLGWPLLIARELRLIPRDITSALIALALVTGLLGVLIILNYERQQHRPFR